MERWDLIYSVNFVNSVETSSQQIYTSVQRTKKQPGGGMKESWNVKRKYKTGIRSNERPSETEHIDYRYAAIGKYFFAFRGNGGREEENV